MEKKSECEYGGGESARNEKTNSNFLINFHFQYNTSNGRECLYNYKYYLYSTQQLSG